MKQKSKIINYLYLLSFSLLPIYYFSSGSIQYSHGLLIVASIFVLFRENKSIVGFYNRTLFIFLIYVFMFEIITELLFPSESINNGFLIPVAYILFNFIVFTACKIWIDNYDQSIFFLKYGIVIAIIVSFMGVLLLGFKFQAESAGGRAIGTFNNPNQLGYFSVCASSILMLLFFKRVISYKELILLSLACMFMAIASLSKAAMLSVAIPICCLPWVLAGLSSSKRILIFMILCVIFAFYILRPHSTITALNKYAFYHRLANIGSQTDDSLYGRGYYLFFQSDSAEMLFGFGPDCAKDLIGHEVHSTMFSVITNYGILGSVFFFSFIFLWLINIYTNYKWFGLVSIVVPPMIYGITHNGTRFTIFWILLSLSFSTKKIYISRKTILKCFTKRRYNCTVKIM